MFWKEHSYNCFKMFLNQLAIGLFGTVLFFAASRAKSDLLMLLLSLGSIVFYLVLVYNTAWEVGSRQFAPVSAGRKAAKPFTGFFIMLVSYIPSLVAALFLILCYYVPNATLDVFKSVSALLALFLDGMYVGVFSYGLSDGESVWIFWYLLCLIPGLAVSTVAYYLGMKGIRFTSPGTSQYPKSDRPTRKELKQKLKQTKDENSDKQ